ncbi:hypothetical protein FACS1894211_03230 [Clostridia bacterium]|nr:hypothetical protein FACS1894211_03230 [Clostridia bacterium]
MEIYYEQYVIDDTKNRNHGKKIFFTVIFWVNAVFIALAALWLYLTFLTLTESFLPLIFPGVFLVLTAVSLFFVRRQKNSLDVDFDYILSGEKLRIIRVFNRRRRKLYLDIDVKKLATYGAVTVDSFNRYEKTPGVKKHYANLTQDETKIYFMYYTDGPDKTLVLFEPDETLLHNMRMAIGRDILTKK